MRICILLSFLFFATNSFSQQCDLAVVDEAGEFGDRIGEVELAVNQLKNVGVDVRIRTVKSIGSSETIQKYFIEQRSKCPSWLSPDGNYYKSDFVLIAHSRQDRQALIVGGTQFQKPLDQNYSRIIADHMRPHFLQNDYTSAFVAGINETQNVIYSHLHPGQSTSTSTTVINTAGAVWGISLLGIVIVVVLIGFVISRYRMASVLNGKLINQKRTEALMSKQQAINRLLHYEELKEFLFKEAGDSSRTFQPIYDLAWRRFGQYDPDHFSFQAEDLDRTAEEYDLLKEAYDEINKIIDKAEMITNNYLPEDSRISSKLLD